MLQHGWHGECGEFVTDPHTNSNTDTAAAYSHS
jgi:hypothetical protein